MRPDRSYTTLKWLSTLGGMFGLDHFYLRNPYSGLLKGLTLGGFLIWWLWDAIQLWTEKDRVLLYGLSAPFDIKMGFGQGTIAGEKTNYEQRSDSAWWILASLFSFAGGDSMMLGNWGQMARKLTELAILAMLVIPMLTLWNEEGFASLLTFGNIFRALIAALIGFIVLNEWVNVAGSTLNDPVHTFKSGIRVSASQDKVLNYPRAWVENIDMFSPKIKAQIMHDIGYSSISGAEMHKSFEVHYTTAKDKAAEAAAEDATTAAEAASNSANPIHWHWLLSYMVYLFGPLIILGQFIKDGITDIFYAIFPGLKVTAMLQEKAMKAAEAAAEGKNPLYMVKGIEAISGSLNAVDKAKQNALDALSASSVGAIKDNIPKQYGGSRSDRPSSQGMILGASVFALAGGAAIKLAVDYLLPQ